jgi:hypothetical protein
VICPHDAEHVIARKEGKTRSEGRGGTEMLMEIAFWGK